MLDLSKFKVKMTEENDDWEHALDNIVNEKVIEEVEVEVEADASPLTSN